MRTLVTFLIGFAVVVTVYAQPNETRYQDGVYEGREYLVAFPKLWAETTEKPTADPLQILISSQYQSTVRISVPATNRVGEFSQTIQVAAGKATTVSVPVAFMNVVAGERRGSAVLIQSDRPISVSTRMMWNGGGELARHLPTSAWGRDHRTFNLYQDKFGYGSNQTAKFRPGQILIVSASDNNIVSYTPTAKVAGGADVPAVNAGVLATAQLNRGETLLLEAAIDSSKSKESSTDLTGTHITSTKPVAVIAGHTKGAIMRMPDFLPPTGSFAAQAHFVRNGMHDVMLPSELAGTRFITAPLMYTSTRVTGRGDAEFGIDDDRGDVIRILALEDQTLIRVSRADGSEMRNLGTIKKGESYMATAHETANLWTTSKPALMMQYGKSYAKIIPPGIKKESDETQGFPTVESGMPMMQAVPPIDRWVRQASFNAPSDVDNFVTIVCRSEHLEHITFDGTPLNPLSQMVRRFASNEYAYMSTMVGVGDHRVGTSLDSATFCAWTYGSRDGLRQSIAYGTPTNINLAMPCADDQIAIVEPTIVLECGAVSALAEIHGSTVPCASIFDISAVELVNYTYAATPSSQEPVRSVDFNLRVVNAAMDASALIRAISRSGKVIERRYMYTATPSAVNPDSVIWRDFQPGVPACITFEVVAPGSGGYRVLGTHALGRPFAFTFEPSVFTVPAGQRQTVTACVNTADAASFVDTAIIQLDCEGTIRVPLYVNVVLSSVSQEDSQQRIVVHPNPAYDVLSVEGIPENCHVSLINVAGEETKVPASSQIDVRAFPTGAYTLKIVYASKVFTTSVLIAR